MKKERARKGVEWWMAAWQEGIALYIATYHRLPYVVSSDPPER